MSLESAEFRPFETRLRVGQIVTVRRGNGDIEDGWEIKSMEEVTRDGMLKKIALLKKPSDKAGEVLYRESTVEELEELNP